MGAINRASKDVVSLIEKDSFKTLSSFNFSAFIIRSDVFPLSSMKR